MRPDARERERERERRKKRLGRADDSDGRVGACLMEDGGGRVGRRSKKEPLGSFDGLRATAVLARALAPLVVVVVVG
jgi:hypothetical protein